MNRRTVLAGAVWATPVILVAKPTEGATLSFPGIATPAQQTPVKQGPPLAFTGDNTETDVGWAAGAIAAGWLLHKWAASDKTLPR